ncbi:MAG: c-type cytochrome [Planctomyces sp.]|nr:c-type cytochrome [Planctomyces sp.]
MRQFCAGAAAIGLMALVQASGCRPASDIIYRPSEARAALSPELQAAVDEQLGKHCGTFAAPKVLGDDRVSTAQLKRGQAVYQLRCAQCHGDDGDGAGPVAAQMYPRPRDYRKGVFKFTSTVFGSRPLRSDLLRTVENGIRGTSMPGFETLPEEEREAVVDYVLALAHRGELEDQLCSLADLEGELDEELVQSEAIDVVVGRWKRARESVIVPTTLEPELTLERVERGRERFLAESTGCFKCHGEDGRGRTPDNLAGNLRDAWGQPTRAADLTSGMLRGGQEPLDVYRRIYGGINGTPMPGFASAYQAEPDALWDLVAYVKYITNRRRAGDRPPPGVIQPFIPPGSSDVPAASDDAG